MKIALGSDKSGFNLKEVIKVYLINLGYNVSDVGTQDLENGIAYVDVAPRVVKLVQSGEANKGILCCGTGMGMAIVANKYKGIYASVVESVYAAKKCRAINNANVLTMGAWIIAPEMACDIVNAFLNTEYFQDLENWRRDFLKSSFKKILELEKNIR